MSVTTIKGLVLRSRTLLLVLFAATAFVGKSFWEVGPLLRLQENPLHVNSMAYRSYQLKSVEGKEPMIYLYNKLYNFSDWKSNWESVDGSSVVKTLTDCPVKCHFTSDPYFLKFADLVLVSIAYYASRFGGKPVNLTYSKGDQVWAAFQIESPLYGDAYDDVDGIFDWVATYKRGSNIFIPYGRFDQVHDPPPNVSLESIRQSLRHKKLATWLVSHCGAISDRETLFKTLQRYMPMDGFGVCAGKTCPETEQLSCRDYLSQNYKFYLAFENSLCHEYVTEKFFLSYHYNMVPVTFGWANYSWYGPPGSYINALEYDSVEDLAKYLLYLDKNDDEYLKYFAWKGKYNVHSFSLNNAMCTVCQTLSSFIKTVRKSFKNEESQGIGPRYPSFRKWYASLPASQTSTVGHIGKTLRVISNNTCIVPAESPVLQKWIRGEKQS